MESPKLFEKSKGTEHEVYPAIKYPVQTPLQGGKLSSVLFHSLNAGCIQTGILGTRWNTPLLKPKATRSTELTPRYEKPQSGSLPLAAEPGSQRGVPGEDRVPRSQAAAQQPEHPPQRSSPADSAATAVQRN